MNSKTGNKPETLAELQKQFAANIRSPNKSPAPPDVEDRRMEIYRNLFFNNVRNLLSWNFPVLKEILSSEDWTQLVRDFYIEHRARTPLFPELPREFLQYLENRKERENDLPFMLELAHYEWAELALSLDENEIDEVEADRSGDLVEGIPVLSPLVWQLSYRFPVHRISPKYQPDEAPEEATHLLVYRNREDEIKFMQLNAVSALLIQFMKDDQRRTGHDLLNEIAVTLNHPNPEAVMEGGKKLLQDLLNRDVILGSLPASHPQTE